MSHEKLMEKIEKLENEMFHIQNSLCKLKDSLDEIKSDLETEDLKEFHITIEERICQTFKIKAKSPEDACHIADEQYCSGELVVTDGECQNVDAVYLDSNDELVKVNIK